VGSSPPTWSARRRIRRQHGLHHGDGTEVVNLELLPELFHGEIFEAISGVIDECLDCADGRLDFINNSWDDPEIETPQSTPDPTDIAQRAFPFVGEACSLLGQMFSRAQMTPSVVLHQFTGGASIRR
jgi:hypothetical protein